MIIPVEQRQHILVHNMKRVRGFTLVELIISIILISILSGVGVALFSSSDQYAARLSMEQWLSAFRFSQRLALLKQDASNVLNVTLTQGSGSWTSNINLAATQLDVFELDRDNINVHMSTSDFVSACSVLPLLSFPATYYFNGYGDAVNSSSVQISSNTRFCFVGQESAELCLSPSGYAYAGSCQP